MSSDEQSALAQLQANDYGSLVIVAAVSYDYCLTFPREITYIWKRPWTWVSVLYLLIRYAGYVSVIWQYFRTGSSKGVKLLSYVSPTVHTSMGYVFGRIRRNIVYLIGTWAYPIFWVGADMVMLLRVYALYNRSRTILGVLLVMYIAEVALLFVSSGIYSDPMYTAVSADQVLNVSVCNIVFSTQTWNNASTIAQFILGTVTFILVTGQFIKHALQVYRATRKWQLNKYISLLVRDGLLYFVVTLFYSLVNMLGILGVIPQGPITQVLMAAINVPLYTLTPRFVMNVRELYAVDSEGRQGRDIDNGFGLSSGAERGVGVSTTIGTIAFADGGGTAGLEDGE